jgi:hypothetical protein
MSNYKIFTPNYRGWILFCVIFLLFAQVSISYGAGRLLAWPQDGGMTQSKSKASLKSYEVRRGQIALAPEILPKNAGAVNRQAGIAPSKGDTVSINLFTDAKYDVKIDSVKHQANGTKIISGKLKDHKNRTVVMTIGSEGYLITVQDMNKSMLYRVIGNSRDGLGSVTEIDMKKMPPVIR